ncbi:MAG TPA: ribonuclease HI [Roseiflexaceae bacterium]|nr:ribonuclease HI [Roseiflexaceae bacterium]
MGKRKFYAVVEGQTPGVYDEWFGAGGAEAQIKGFRGAVYKGFASLEEAESWFVGVAGYRPARFLSQAPAPAPSLAVDPQAALAAGKVVIFTDGASAGNPGPGGYAAVMRHGERRRELSGGYARTTNNRMELMGVIAALHALSGRRTAVVYSDSSYVVNGIVEGWARRWREQGWTRSASGAREPVKNADLWQRLLALCEQHDVTFVQVQGHAGVPENERCDRLAVAASQRPGLPPDEGFAE